MATEDVHVLQVEHLAADTEANLQEAGEAEKRLTNPCCWLLGHRVRTKVYAKSFYSPSLDKMVDLEQTYCNRCDLGWPEWVPRGNLYHRTVKLWASQLTNWWIFRKYRWTPKRAAEYDAFLQQQIKLYKARELQVNKQPFYHRATVLFTATRDIPPNELQNILRTQLATGRYILVDSIEVEECDAEPGDPADLMGNET